MLSLYHSHFGYENYWILIIKVLSHSLYYNKLSCFIHMLHDMFSCGFCEYGAYASEKRAIYV